MKRVLFFDPSAKRPYTMNTVRSYAMGASESSLMRVAAGLAARPGFEVDVFQLCDPQRQEAVVDKVRHVNADSLMKPDVVVHQRKGIFVEDLAMEYPNARHIVWMHDLGGDWLSEQPMKGKEIVCVSDFHSKQLYGELWRLGQAEALTIHRIYNPVVVDGPRADKVKGRLGFFSSPHKGLEDVVGKFQSINRPELHLVVANPGYIPDAALTPLCVTNLGQLSHSQVCTELSKCEVLFYPQTTHPETFGVVLAEANAMGVPVLCHDMGAAEEILGRYDNEVIDCTKPGAVAEALAGLMEPDAGPVAADPRFALDKIVSEWVSLLEGR